VSGPPRLSAAWDWLGLELISVEEGTATVDMVAQPQMANASGNLHGGVIGTLADSAMGRAVHTLQPRVRRAASFDLKLNFIAPARIGDTLRATAHVLHAGRRTCVTECRVEGRGGRLIATASGTFMVSREEQKTSVDH
jgi:acyl-CoA thioesterase